MKQIHFILVNPATPGNIGSAARAIKTMGFQSLRLVNPANHLDKEAKKLAYGSHDILESAEMYSTLGEALADIDFSIATTAKKRTVFHDYLAPRECIRVIEEKGDATQHVSIVFGSEENGLSKEDIGLCDVRSSIPLAAPYPSLNLGQSVMLYAYEFSALSLSTDNNPVARPNEGEQRTLKEQAEKMLRFLEVDRNPNLYRRMIERLMLTNEDDLHLLLSFHKHLARKLSQET